MTFKQISEALNVREGTHRETLIKKLAANFGKPVSRDALRKAVYGAKAEGSAIDMVLRGLEAMIAKNKAPLAVERSEAGIALTGKARKSKVA